MGMPPSALAGKRIVITGGTTRIARAATELLAFEGARILIAGRDRLALDECLARARDREVEVFGIAVDVAARSGVDAIFAAADEALGGLDILIVCASLGVRAIEETADADWRDMVETNLIGAMACARAAIERMEGAGGQLLFVGSVSSEIETVGESVYAATTAGLLAFAETLRKELADREIKVGALQPGSTATDPQTGNDAVGREAVADLDMLHAREIAEAIRFMLTRSAGAEVANLRIEPLRPACR